MIRKKIDSMFHRHGHKAPRIDLDPEIAMPAVSEAEHEETERAKTEATRVMNRADRWMQEAMKDAHRAFHYIGPDRRRLKRP